MATSFVIAYLTKRVLRLMAITTTEPICTGHVDGEQGENN